MADTNNNPLGVKKEGELLRQFAIPSIIAMLVGSLYNIVDQFFIGRSIGELGNAATNIVFPFSIACVATALLFGIGGASAFNLALGAGDRDKAPEFIGSAVSCMVGIGLILMTAVLLWTDPLLKLFGSPAEVMKYAASYVRITALGFPMFILSSGGGHLVRADGSPKVTMLINVIGAVINTILDAVFVFGFKWGMTGAAAATVIGQVVSGLIVLFYLTRFRTVQLKPVHFIPKAHAVTRTAALGSASFVNQLSMMVVQILLNNSLRHYGGQSVYGESIPIACAGIISKVGAIFFSFVIGISQGLQPIASFNYGAKKYSRVKKAYLLAIASGSVIAVLAFLVFQIFPRQIISIFGKGSDNYYQFAVRYFRIFLFAIFLCFLQPITSNFFTAIGKPKKGMFLSLTRQIIFLVPLILILPFFWGIDGLMFAGPIADITATAVSLGMVVHELHKPEFKTAV